MTRRRTILGLTIFVAWLGAALVGKPEAVLPKAEPRADPARVEVLGLAGCAARGCHGGPSANPDGSRRSPDWQNACTNWLRYDRHTEAYRALLTEKSAKIMGHLAKVPDGGWAKNAFEEKRCLACHSTPALATDTHTPEMVRLRMEGVSCDACHTQPGKSTSEWIEPHKKGWSAGGLADCFQNHGMQWQNDTKLRAATCVACHVGAPAGNGVPAREVTHDLIAAGHPRLNFEYVTYLAMLPPHWTEQERRRVGDTVSESPRPTGFRSQSWLVGQVESARAGMNLTADQATRPDAVWPELTAFNCYACHHDLPSTPNAPGAWRQRRMESVKNVSRPGQVSGNLISDSLRQILHDPDAEVAGFVARTGTNASGMASACRKLSGQLDELASKPASALQGPKAGGDLVKSLNLGSRDLSLFTWDDAAQSYYALMAANLDRDPSSNRPRDEIDTALADLATRLKLPRSPEIVNSPRGFDPDNVAKRLKDVSGQLAAWYESRK